MHRRVVLPLAAVLVLALLAAACGGGGDDGDTTDTAPPGTAPSTTAADTNAVTDTTLPLGPPTTRGPAPEVTVEPVGSLGAVTVVAGEPAYRGVLGQIDPDRMVVAPAALPPAPAEPGVAPLTGLPSDDPALATRPALLAKIDNTHKGRPQESLAEADLVYEEMIEGGFTRLAAVFHTNAPTLGPVRSGRTTDIALLGSLARPVFVWSGANDVHAALLRRQDIIDLGAQTRNEYRRAADRPSTYDLLTDASTMFDLAAERDPVAPPPHFEYRDAGICLPATAAPATSVAVDFPSVAVRWDWDEAAGGWVRTQGGTPHVDAQGRRVTAANVLVAEVRQVATGAIDTAGSTVYEEQFLGSGRGWVLTDGHVVEVTWTKPSIHSVATWTTPDGVPVALVPGITWVELAPPDVTTVA